MTVVIPAYNAEATLDRTLESVRTQSHSRLEIIVVDDGSVDRSAAVVHRHAAVDCRVRLLHQRNSGVAAARNAGIAAASGEFIASIDADDIWARTKIARQLEAIGTDRSVGLVYCWFCVIDDQNRIISYEGNSAQGDVFEAMLVRNLLGNGSSALIRRCVFEQCGYYASDLRDRGAEGCEDYALYLRIAESYQFRLVPEYLVGYRETQGNMSSDALRMLRSRILCMAPFRARHPELTAVMDAGRSNFIRYLLIRSMRARAYRTVACLVREHWRLDRRGARDLVGDLGWRSARHIVRKVLSKSRGEDLFFLPLATSDTLPPPAAPRTVASCVHRSAGMVLRRPIRSPCEARLSRGQASHNGT